MLNDGSTLALTDRSICNTRSTFHTRSGSPLAFTNRIDPGARIGHYLKAISAWAEL